MQWIFTPILLLAMLAGTASASDRVLVGDFSSGLEEWRERSFNGKTTYSLVDLNGESVLQADANGTASALYRTLNIDLRETPYLHWRWRIDSIFDGVDELTKAGDDYPARIYVVKRNGLAFWRTRALNYVWSNHQPVGSRWPNAYAGDNAQMLALDSGPELVGQWVTQVRNVREDLREAFGIDIDIIDGVALMTDADDTGDTVRAWYGDIYFSASPQPLEQKHD